jgi:hypothetical protein
METVSTAISPLGFALDQMVQRVLTCMNAARSGGASAWLAGAGGGMGVRAGARRSQDRGNDAAAEVRATGGRRRVNGVNPDSGRPIYRGSTESGRCSSFRRTTRSNGSIPRSPRKDYSGFVADQMKPRPKPCV